MSHPAAPDSPAIVLVHGAFVDGSGWQEVYQILKKDGYPVSIVQNPTESLQGDVATTKRALSAQDRPVILVGHSYGGAVITEAGNHPSVVGLVYINAFAPDAGESVGAIIEDPPAGADVPSFPPPQDGYVVLDKATFPQAFAGDVDAEKATFMADSQVPFGLQAVAETVTEPAWKTRPSWYLTADADRIIPPPLQRRMFERAGSTVVEVPGSHAIYVSRPDAVAAIIEQAAREVAVAA
jgi:pimeloyl-ACP methyl ester carboxylesterase